MAGIVDPSCIGLSRRLHDLQFTINGEQARLFELFCRSQRLPLTTSRKSWAWRLIARWNLQDVEDQEVCVMIQYKQIAPFLPMPLPTSCGVVVDNTAVAFELSHRATGKFDAHR